jgi:hypothetical protein
VQPDEAERVIGLIWSPVRHAGPAGARPAVTGVVALAPLCGCSYGSASGPAPSHGVQCVGIVRLGTDPLWTS